MYFSRLIEFSTIPKTAAPKTIPNKVHPKAPCNVTNVYGTYVPNISKKILQWSKTLNTFLAVIFGLKLWYKVDIKYNIIIKLPYNDELTTPTALPSDADFIIHNTIPAIASNTPIPCDIALISSSERVYLGFITSSFSIIKNLPFFYYLLKLLLLINCFIFLDIIALFLLS